jgi:hypothetical protein
MQLEFWTSVPTFEFTKDCTLEFNVLRESFRPIVLMIYLS